MPTTISGDTGVSQCQPGSVNLGDIASGALVETGGAGVGYGTGAGGTVTQATSKGTAVTLNKPTGQITMHNAALAGGGATVMFVLNNSILSATDVLLVTVQYPGISAGNYSVRVGNTVSGAANIVVKNESVSSLSEAVILNFAIIKGAAA